MSSDLRTTLDGFDTSVLEEQLKKIVSEEKYAYYADVIRAFTSTNSKAVSEFQQDPRFLVAAAASCNPIADLELLNKNLKRFALVAALNPSINEKILRNLQKQEHPASKCSDEMFNYDLISMWKGGAYVDAPLLSNPSFPTELKDEFESLAIQIEKAGK